MKNEQWCKSSQGYSRVMIDERISSSLCKCCRDISEVFSTLNVGEGILEVEIINMVLVVFEEENRGWISSRTMILESRECSQKLVRRDPYSIRFGK